MRIPDSVKVGPTSYSVKWQKEIRNPEGCEALGFTDHIRQQVVLRRGMAQSRVELTFMHEVLHAMGDVYGVTLDEGQVDRLATALLAFLKDNGFLE